MRRAVRYADGRERECLSRFRFVRGGKNMVYSCIATCACMSCRIAQSEDPGTWADLYPLRDCALILNETENGYRITLWTVDDNRIAAWLLPAYKIGDWTHGDELWSYASYSVGGWPMVPWSPANVPLVADV